MKDLQGLLPGLEDDIRARLEETSEEKMLIAGKYKEAWERGRTGVVWEVWREKEGMRFNVQTQVDYWRTGSDQDWSVAVDLIQRGSQRHGLFFLHLAMEKLLKAHVCLATKDFPPKFHNLLLLRSRTGLDLSVNALELLGRLNAFCLVGRYPDDPVIETIPPHVAQRYVIEAGKVRTWLLQELSQLLKII
ncbi:MAG: HEPN domain-containing protein [Magnetococcales bacterium]|nr:HEPN domain-containing protein [Magnetococcales bacterium]